MLLLDVRPGQGTNLELKVQLVGGSRVLLAPGAHLGHGDRGTDLHVRWYQYQYRFCISIRWLATRHFILFCDEISIALDQFALTLKLIYFTDRCGR